jgi:hypothetical protein
MLIVKEEAHYARWLGEIITHSENFVLRETIQAMERTGYSDRKLKQEVLEISYDAYFPSNISIYMMRLAGV